MIKICTRWSWLCCWCCTNVGSEGGLGSTLNFAILIPKLIPRERAAHENKKKISQQLWVTLARPTCRHRLLMPPRPPLWILSPPRERERGGREEGRREGTESWNQDLTVSGLRASGGYEVAWMSGVGYERLPKMTRGERGGGDGRGEEEEGEGKISYIPDENTAWSVVNSMNVFLFPNSHISHIRFSEWVQHIRFSEEVFSDFLIGFFSCSKLSLRLPHRCSFSCWFRY